MTSAELETRDSITLVELVDRLLDKGVVISGDVTIAVADIDLIRVGLRALVSSVEAIERDV
jgi:gas vesicle structural protein